MKNFTKKMLKVVLLIFILFSLFNINIKQYINQSVNYFNNNTQIKELNYNTLNDVFSTNLLQENQLIPNGDFTNGTTGYTIASPQNNGGGTLSIVNGNLIIVSNSSSVYSQLYITNYTIELNTKYYTNIKIRNLSDGAGGFTFYMGTPNTLYLPSISNPVKNQWYSNSGIFSVSSGTLDFFRILTTGTAPLTSRDTEIEYIYQFNVTQLQTNKQYSPLYQTTFDLMTDEEIKLQMDQFIEKPYQFIDYESLYLLNLNLTTQDMDYYYNLYRKNRKE